MPQKTKRSVTQAWPEVTFQSVVDCQSGFSEAVITTKSTKRFKFLAKKYFWQFKHQPIHLGNLFNVMAWTNLSSEKTKEVLFLEILIVTWPRISSAGINYRNNMHIFNVWTVPDIANYFCESHKKVSGSINCGIFR